MYGQNSKPTEENKLDENMKYVNRIIKLAQLIIIKEYYKRKNKMKCKQFVREYLKKSKYQNKVYPFKLRWNIYEKIYTILEF